MTRQRFGGDVTAWVFGVGAGNTAVLQGSAVITCWNQQTGGTQYNNLSSDAGGTVLFDHVTASDGSSLPLGVIPPFYGPDGVWALWASANGGTRLLLVCNDLGDTIGATVFTTAASLTAHMATINGHGTTLASLLDVSSTPPLDGQVLQFSAAAGNKWIAAPLPGLGTPGVVAGVATGGIAAANTVGPVSTTSTLLTEDTTPTLASPERGFFEYSETHVHPDMSGWTALDPVALTSARTTSGHTLVFRYFYLEKYLAQDTIDTSVLNNIAADLAAVRTAGCKLIVRFAYSNTFLTTPPYNSDPAPSRVQAHIAQLLPVLNAAADVIYAVQAGFIGTWGEWYYSDNFTTPPSTPGTLSTQNWTDRTAVLNALLNGLDARIFVLIRYVGIKDHVFGDPTTNPLAARMGFHNDAFLASTDDYGTYSTFTPWDVPTTKAYLSREVARPVPNGGESANLNSPRSDWSSAAVDLAAYEFTYLNPNYEPNVLASWGSNIDIAKRQLGYRLVGTVARSQASIARGSTLRVELEVSNNGYAPPVNPRPVVVVLDNGSGGRLNATTNIDIRAVTPGAHQLWANVAVPTGIPAGTYKLALWMPDRDSGLQSRPEYSLRLPNVGTWDATNGYNVLRTITVT